MQEWKISYPAWMKFLLRHMPWLKPFLKPFLKRTTPLRGEAPQPSEPTRRRWVGPRPHPGWSGSESKPSK